MVVRRVTVRCGEVRHVVEVSKAGARLLDHDEEAEGALTALGGGTTPCQEAAAVLRLPAEVALSDVRLVAHCIDPRSLSPAAGAELVRAARTRGGLGFAPAREVAAASDRWRLVAAPLEVRRAWAWSWCHELERRWSSGDGSGTPVDAALERAMAHAVVCAVRHHALGGDHRARLRVRIDPDPSAAAGSVRTAADERGRPRPLLTVPVRWLRQRAIEGEVVRGRELVLGVLHGRPVTADVRLLR